MSMSELQRLQEAREEARKTGKRIRRVFDRQQLAKESPAFGSDPRTGFTPNQFILDVGLMEALTVKELREICSQGKTEKAKKLLENVQGLAENVVVNVYREDLDAAKGQVVAASEEDLPHEDVPAKKSTKKKAE